MKTKIYIEGSDIKLSLMPDTDLERLVIRELGDDISVSRSHQDIVLRRRVGEVRSIIDGMALDGALDQPAE
jgi:hypothetical protein